MVQSQVWLDNNSSLVIYKILVRPATIRNFTEAFAKYKLSETTFCPVYGLGEATLMVAHPPTRNPTAPVILKIARDSLSTGKYFILELCLLKFVQEL